ncbi:MAG: hypothetical protein JWQ29_423 [Phenylobacterium sp.]|nr:hypothetical protein [Phenylobacterium sp.]
MPRRKLALATFAAFALAWAGAADAAGYRAPRTPSGQPDLQGVWSTASLTTLERLAAFDALVVGEAQARAYEAGDDGTPHLTDPTGQNDTEWWERGATLGRLGGQARSSWLIDPADGRLPYSAAGAKALKDAQAALLTRFDGPEQRPTSERCLMGLGGTTGAPLQNSSYNNLYQLVQTPDHVVIAAEMIHDVRIIPLKEGRPPFEARSWSGVSVGRWEGDTLVVETTGFHARSGWRTPSRLYLSPDAKVTERVTRTSPTEIRYEYAVDDPAVFTRVWRAEMPMRRSPGPIYEFACHEGNYSLSGVLAGGRQQEREAAGRQGAPPPP